MELYKIEFTIDNLTKENYDKIITELKEIKKIENIKTSNSAPNGSYASPVSSGVQTAGLNKALEDIANKLTEVETDVRIEITIEKGYGCISLYDQYADKIGDYDTNESLRTMEDVLDFVIGRAKHLPKE